MELNEVLKSGIKNISNTAKRFYLKNHQGRKFMLKLAQEFRKDTEIREHYEISGTHIPPFLIASIAEECNLHCPGCYARATGGCGEQAKSKQMPLDDWRRIFSEASGLGMHLGRGIRTQRRTDANIHNTARFALNNRE